MEKGYKKYLTQHYTHNYTDTKTITINNNNNNNLKTDLTLWFLLRIFIRNTL